MSSNVVSVGSNTAGEEIENVKIPASPEAWRDADKEELDEETQRAAPNFTKIRYIPEQRMYEMYDVNRDVSGRGTCRKVTYSEAI